MKTGWIKTALAERSMKCFVARLAQTRSVCQCKSKLWILRPSENVMRLKLIGTSAFTAFSSSRVKNISSPLYCLRPLTFALHTTRLLSDKVPMLFSSDALLTLSRAYESSSIWLVENLSTANAAIKTLATYALIPRISSHVTGREFRDGVRGAFVGVPRGGFTFPKMRGPESRNPKRLHCGANGATTATKYLADYFRAYALDAIELSKRGFARQKHPFTLGDCAVLGKIQIAL